MEHSVAYLVFDGDQCLVSGLLPEVLTALKTRFNEGSAGALLVFDAETGKQRDFDLAGSLDDVLARVEPAPLPKPGPGRPKLGVVAREISLLPRHWEWLEGQPSGASAAIRRLVDEARNRDPQKEQARIAREATGRFLTAVAGNRAGFEEALRALYAGNCEGFEARIAEWPPDIRAHASRMAEPAWLG